MNKKPEELQAVFYSGPIPTNVYTLTILGLVFDRVHFPNVYLPIEGFDPQHVRAEIVRINSLNLTDFDTWQLVEMMKYVLTPELREFCYFTGTPDQVFGGKDMESENARKLVDALYQQIYGPPRKGFIPTFIPGYHKGLGNEATVDYPGPLFYQSNALLYAGLHDIPLLNDNPHLPVLPLPNLEQGVKNNVKLLTTIMAMECVKFVLPEIPGLQPQQILEARQDLAPYLRPFRLGMLQLAGKLNAQIDSQSDEKEVMRAADFIVQTEVYPALAELKNELAKPSKGWIDRTYDATKKVPQVIAACSVFDLQTTVPALITLLADWLSDNFQKEKPRSNLYYLLRLQDRMK